MKISFVILFSLIYQMTYSQISFQSDLDKTPIHPEIASQIDSIYPTCDFQFRFWIDGSLLRLNKKRLITMTQIDGRWICQSFKFVYNGRIGSRLIKPEKQIDNCDTVWNYFMQNHILDLPTMDELKVKFNDLNEDKGTNRTIVADGETYFLEFIEKDKYKRLEYHCPITYFKNYPEIQELSDISNIIKQIFTLAKIKYEPC